jgi:hypothetical protein
MGREGGFNNGEFPSFGVNSFLIYHLNAQSGVCVFRFSEYDYSVVTLEADSWSQGSENAACVVRTVGTALWDRKKVTRGQGAGAWARSVTRRQKCLGEVAVPSHGLAP